MSFFDTTFYQSYVIRWITQIFFLLLIFCGQNCAGRLFRPGKEYSYSYNAISSSGVLLPSEAESSWSMHGELVIQAKEDSVILQLQSLKTNVRNGKIDEPVQDTGINDDANELLKPFQAIYKMGLIETFNTEAEPVWATNIKRSIAGILQLDLPGLNKEVAFHSIEVNHYGQCTVEYVVSPMAEKESLVRKSWDPRSCVGHPHRTWTNVPKMQCGNNEQNPVMKASERLYGIRFDETDQDILFVNATGDIYVQPFQSFGEAHYLTTKQSLELTSIKDITGEITMSDVRSTVLQHELPENDLTQGRGIPDKDTIFKYIGNLLDRLSQRLETPGLDMEIDNLHNTTISVLLYYLEMLDCVDLRTAYNKISGTSYKEETIRNMFLEALPQIGTKEAALFILELIQDKKVSDIAAIQLLTHLPFHVRKPDVQLLVSLQSLLNLPGKIALEVQNTAILMYGTLIYKTCLLYCPYEMLDDYVRLYLDKFTECTEYEKKMVWLEGLANIQLGRVVEFLEPIASGSNSESRHFRVLAAWASLPTAPLRPDVIYPVYWPMLVNRTEHLEMRIAALTLLIVSSPTPSRLISLYWYMQTEPSQHLYNFFYTTIKSLEHTTYPCYQHIGSIAAQFSRILRKPANNRYVTTGNYLFDYQDMYRKFGAMLHGIVIANPLTNIPEVMYVTFNNYGSGTNINNVALYVKAEGLLHSLSMIETPTQVRDILKNFKLDSSKQSTPVHLEIIARVQGKTVLCLHLNQTNIMKAFKYLDSLPDQIYYIYHNMEFHVNQQRINVPLMMETVQVTDLGTNVRIAVSAKSLFSMRGNFTHVPNGRNNHVILRSSIHGTEMVENYNPLIDLWHSAERTQSFHGYLPINVTIGFEERPFISYNTPGEHLKTGITAHARTVTTVRGAKAKSKLKKVCPQCPTLYTVTKSPTSEHKTVDLVEADISELGGQLHIKIFDCENVVSLQKVVTDILSAFRANYQVFSAMRFPLMAIHFLDYFTYIPPKGSCGMAAYIESLNSQRSQVKLEYVQSGSQHMLSLTHSELETLKVLHQWNVAALYEITSWVSESLKVKATKLTPGQKVMKFCLEGEKETPWEWEFLSTKPVNPTKMKINIVWGLSDTAKGKCTGSSILLNLSGELTTQQIDESEAPKWPYAQCREDSIGKNYVPYTDSCLEASNELSTLRKYQILLQYKNLPENLSTLLWKLRAFYNLYGVNSSATNSDQFHVSAVFPRELDIGELHINQNHFNIEYDFNVINYFLTRSRIHKYVNSPLIRSFLSTCVITKDYVKSVHNVTIPFKKAQQILLLADCYDENPRFAFVAKNDPDGISIDHTDETGIIKVAKFENGGAVYNSTTRIPLERNSEFHRLNSKRVRLSDRSVDLIVSNILLFMHWTQEQTLLFFPNYLLKFSCGICAADNANINTLYQKLT